jgi:hypothetical protein
MPNEIIETLTLCIGGHNDGRGVRCEGRQREKYIRLTAGCDPTGLLQYEVYRLEQIYGRTDTHWLYLLHPMEIDDAVRMLIAKYPQGETTT